MIRKEGKSEERTSTPEEKRCDNPAVMAAV